MTYITSNGYRKLKVGHDHPMADSKGECHEHRIVASLSLGRPLKRHEVVHHRDGDKLNNDPSNLLVCASHAEHFQHHRGIVTDAELRELILVCGYRTRQLRERGIGNTHRVQDMFHALRAEGHDLSQRVCPNGHWYPKSVPQGRKGKTRCRVCIANARVRKNARFRQRRKLAAA